MCRQMYKGKLTYGTNWSEQPGSNVEWWDQLDFIGIDAYFPVATHSQPSIQEIRHGWQRWVSLLFSLAQKWDKTILFTEIGYESRTDTAVTPWSAEGPLDLQAQVNAYSGFFESVYSAVWFDGVFIWSWSNEPNDGGVRDTGFTPHDKPAESVLHSYYTNQSHLQSKGSSLIIF